MKVGNNLHSVSWFGSHFNHFWSSINFLNYYNKFLAKLLPEDIEEPLSMQALEQNSDYRSYEEWRSALQRNLKGMIRAIRKPLGVAPEVLRDALIAQQEDISLGFSALDYELYFQKLEYAIENKYHLPKAYAYALKEARARLRQKLEEQPDLALRCFYQDVVNHILRASTYFVAPKNLSNVLSYYKALIPEHYYTSVLAELSYQASNPTNAYYKQLLQSLSKAFEGAASLASQQAQQSLQSVQHYSKYSIFSSLLVAASLFTENYYRYSMGNYLTEQLSFNAPISILSSALINYGLTHTRSATQNSALFNFASLLSSLSVVSAQTPSPVYATFIKEFDVSDNPQYPYTIVDLRSNLAIEVNPDGSFSNFALSSLSTVLATKFSSNGALLQTDSIMLENTEDSTALGVMDMVPTTDGGMAIVASSTLAKYSSNNLIQWAYKRIDNDYSGDVNFAAKAVATSDNALITVGGGDSFITVKFSNAGAVLWQYRINFQDYSIFNTDYSITVTFDNNVVMGGVANKPVDSVYVFSPFLIKMNNNGGLMWARIVSGIHNGYLDDIASIQDNSVIAIGRYMDPSLPPGYAICYYAWIAKVSSDGELQWAKSIYPMDDFDDYDSVGPTALVTAPDNNIIFAGFWAKPYLMKYRSSDGALLWSKSMKVDRMYLSTEGSLSFMPDGSLLIASPAYFNANGGLLIAKLTADADLPGCNNMHSVSIPVSNLTLSLFAPTIQNKSPEFTSVSIQGVSEPINVEELASVCDTSQPSWLSKELFMMVVGGGALVLVGSSVGIACYLKNRKANSKTHSVENINVEAYRAELGEKTSLITPNKKTFEGTINNNVVSSLKNYSWAAQSSKNASEASYVYHNNLNNG